MGLKGLLDRNEEPSDIESERDALRRQRAEAAAELETLKRTVSERVVAVQQRERELAEALTRVEKREEKLAAAEARGSRLDSVPPEARGSEGDPWRAGRSPGGARTARGGGGRTRAAVAAQGQDEPLPQPAPTAQSVAAEQPETTSPNVKPPLPSVRPR